MSVELEQLVLSFLIPFSVQDLIPHPHGARADQHPCRQGRVALPDRLQRLDMKRDERHLLAHPASRVAQGGLRACAKCLLQGDGTMQKVVKESLRNGAALTERILMMLDAVSLRDQHTVESFRGEIVRLCVSPNQAIRARAAAICRRIQCAPATPPRSAVLPAIYLLSLPPGDARRLDHHTAISAGEPLPDSEDPAEIVRPFDLQLGVIAAEAQLPKINVCNRAVQIMRQLAPPDSWSAHSEETLRETLDSAGLRLPFLRPRAVLAHRAMFYVIAELVDAEVLSPHNLDALGPLLRFYDPAMLLAEPGPRAAAVQPMLGRSQYGGGNEDWLEEVDRADASVGLKTADGHTILAEETRLKRPEWESPTEIRRSQVCTSGTSELYARESPRSFFQEVVNNLVEKYDQLGSDTDPTPLILRHTAYGYHSPGTHWLALNPTIAHQVGWHRAESGLFNWVDSEGTTMVESVWWTDGFVEQPPPHLEVEVGEGWMVVASKTALDTLISKLGALKQIVSVERSFAKGQEVIEHNMRSVRVVQ